MTELTKKLLTGLLRVALVPFTDWLIAHGILTNDETVTFVAEVASWTIAITWTIVAWVKQHRRERTALAMSPGSTPADLSNTIKAGQSAPLLTPNDVAPRLMSKFIVVLALALSSLTLPGCALFQPPASVTTAQGQAAFRADVAVQRLGELQTVAIEANRSHLIPDATATRIVQFTVGSIRTLKDAPEGWQATVATGWAQLKSVLPPLDPTVAAALNAVDLALALIGGAR